MGCRCNERKHAITRGASAVVRGDIKAAASAGSFVMRTLAQDARSGSLRSAAEAKLTQMRGAFTRRR